MTRRVSQVSQLPQHRPRARLAVATRRDWGAILRDLAAAGVPLAAVARACCRDISTLRAWAAGGEPKDSDGRIVLALYAKYCPALYLADEQAHVVHLPG